MLEPIGFWSYTRLDDEHSGGRLSALRKRLFNELRPKVGGRRKVEIFQDNETIPFGSDWQAQIDAWLDAASFFIAIITPSFLQSEGCCYEVIKFRERAAAQGWDGVIFPLYYNDADEFADVRYGDCHDPAVRDFLWKQQIFNFRDLRLRNPDSEEVSQRIATLAQAIYLALLRDGKTATPMIAPPVVASASAAIVQSIAVTTSAPKPGSIIRDGPGPEMVLIPDGSFVMGISPEETTREGVTASDDDDARPQHRVTIARPFYLGKCPVTRGEFAVFAKATGFADKSWQKPGFAQSDQHPVVNVSHTDATAFAAWLSRETGKDYRLPTEAEWEYAARAATVTARFWGDGRAEACRYANVADETLRKVNKDEPDAQRYFGCDDGYAYTSPVGSFQPNGFGLYDVLGNVWEWVADHWQDSYDKAPDNGSAWLSGNGGPRVPRGGSWNSLPRSIRAGYRSRDVPGGRDHGIGFRLARTL